MRLGLVCNTADYVAVHMADFLRALARTGANIFVTTPDGPARPRLEERGMPWSDLRLRRGRNGVWDTPGAALAIRRFRRRHRLDLVLHITALPVLAGAFASTGAGNSPSVYVLPGLGHMFALSRRGLGWEQRALKALFRWVAGRPRSTVVFQHEADRLRALGDATGGRDRVRVLPGWGVDLTRFGPRRVSVQSPMVVMVTRLLWEKGVGDFVEAARLVRALRPEARFVLIGEADRGNPGSIPDHVLAGWVAEGVIEAWGWQDDIPTVLAQAAILVHPTRYGEGIPRILTEAAAAGVPLVASDIAGCREAVEPDVNGLVVAPGDLRAMAGAITGLLSDPERCARMGKAGRESAARRFNVDSVLQEYMGLFHSLVAPPMEAD